MRGTLAEFTLAQLLQFFALAERTGVVLVNAEDRESRLLIEGDRVVGWGPERYDVRAEIMDCRTLPARLIDAISSISRRDDTPGLSFVVRNLIEPDRWEMFTQRVLEQDVYPLLNAEEGDFEVEVTRCPPSPVRLSISVNSLILDGSRWESEVEAARHEGITQRGRWRRTHPDAIPDRVTLSRVEWLVWSQLVEPTSVAELASELCLPELTVMSAVRKLLGMSMIEEMGDAELPET